MISDLLGYKTRSLLVVAAIALGITGVGSILTAYVILSKDIRSNYLGVNPPAALVWTSPGLRDEDEDAVRSLPGVGQTEDRPLVMARALKGEDSWEVLWLFVVEDFDRLRLGGFKLESGRWPGDGEIVVERDGWRLIDTPVGDTISVRLGEGTRQDLRISGRVHDPGQSPSHMDHRLYGYITRSTYRAMAPSAEPGRLLVSVSDHPFDRDHIRSVARSVVSSLEARGLRVTRVEVPVPGRHPHQGQLESLLFLLGGIGGLTFVLCSILIVNIMTFLLARQVRQVGIMKAIGATPAQVIQIYYFAVACLGGVAALVGVPLGVLAGKAYARFAARELNFNVLTTELPHWLYFGLAGAAVLMPVIVATVPILRGTRISVLSALRDHGLAARGASGSRLSALLGRVALPRHLRLGVSAALQDAGRLAMTVGTLGLGLTILSVAMNLSATLSNTLQQSGDSQRFDLSILLGKPYPVGRIADRLAEIEGIDEISYWQGGMTPLVRADGTQSSSYSVIALPPRTRAMTPIVLDGAWLSEGSADGVVVNQELASAEQLRAGSSIELSASGAIRRFSVLGVIKEIGEPTLYMPQATWRAMTGDGDTTSNVRIAASSRDPIAQLALSRRVERALEEDRVDVISALRKAERIRLIKDHLAIIMSFLIASSLLALVVAGLGLVSTMSVSIIERTRETGVMRAIGATLSNVRSMFLAEGLVVGVLSWVTGLLLAVPVSSAVSSFFGMLVFEAPLELVLSGLTAPVSLGVMIAFVVLAISAAVGTSRNTVRAALAYE